MVSAAARIACVALLVSIVPIETPEAADDSPPPHIERFVVFGDSLSDPGNTFIATEQFEVRPFDPVPDAPYLIGRFHFSNGPTWVEQLARRLGIPRSARPALDRPGVYTNYAFGRARARLDGEFDLGGQIGLFLADFDQEAPPEALYVLWIGANDLRDAFQALQQDPTGATTQLIIQEAIGATAAAIQSLFGAGARSFLVPNLPNIGDTPAIRALEAQIPGVREIARQLAEGYNTGLESTLDQLEGLLGVMIVRLDVFGILEEVVADPDLAKLRNVTDSCITPGVILGAICRNPPPRKYLFWDFIHPTRSAHQYLGEQAREVLEMDFQIATPAF